MKNIREDLADYSHDAWSRNMMYLFSVSKENADGSFTIPVDKVDRWKRQMETDYLDLPESEKQSDKDEVDKIMKIINSKG